MTIPIAQGVATAPGRGRSLNVLYEDLRPAAAAAASSAAHAAASAASCEAPWASVEATCSAARAERADVSLVVRSTRRPVVESAYA